MEFKKKFYTDDATTAANEKNDDLRRVLLIACAGSHQIWAVFLDTTIWWKYKTYTEGNFSHFWHPHEPGNTYLLYLQVYNVNIMYNAKLALL